MKNPLEYFCSEKILYAFQMSEMPLASILLNPLCNGSAKAAVMERISGLTGNGVRSLSHALAHTFLFQGVQ